MPNVIKFTQSFKIVFDFYYCRRRKVEVFEF